MSTKEHVIEHLWSGGKTVIWTVVRDGSEVWVATARRQGPGAWIMTDFLSQTWAWADLRKIRQLAIGGNGKRYGRHTGVARVVRHY